MKISRDGTELEPGVGARLLKEFDAVESGITSAIPALAAPVAGTRRVAYPPTPFRSLPSMYQQQTRQIPGQGATYLPYNAAPAPKGAIYTYGQPRAMHQPPQPPQYISGSGQYPYYPGNLPPQPPL